MSDLIIFCKACQMAHRPTNYFPTVCPNPDCQINPARWTTFRPTAEPREPFHNSLEDRDFLRKNGFSQDD